MIAIIGCALFSSCIWHLADFVMEVVTGLECILRHRAYIKNRKSM